MQITPPLGEGASDLAGAAVVTSGSTPMGGDVTGTPGSNTVTTIGGVPVATIFGEFVTRDFGGQEFVKSHGSMGATETIDLSDGNYHYGTLDADCTFTFTGTGTGACGFTLELAEDGAGGHTPTWPGSVVWAGGTAPTHDTTAGTTSFYVFVSRDGGTVWYGFAGTAAGSGGLASISDGVTTVSPVSSATVPLGGVTDLTGGNARLNFIPNAGAIERVVVSADCGVAYTIDWSAGNTFDLTMTEACVFSFSNVPTVTDFIAAITVFLRGAFASTWPASVTWLHGAPTGATLDPLVFTSQDGGTTVGGIIVGTGGGSVSFGTPALTLGTTNAPGASSDTIRTDATIAIFDTTDPTTLAFDDVPDPGASGVAADRAHRHGMPAAPAGATAGKLLISDSHASPIIFADILQNDAMDDLLYVDV